MLWKIRFDFQKQEEILFPFSLIRFFIAPRLQGEILTWKWPILTLIIGVFKGFSMIPSQSTGALGPELGMNTAYTRLERMQKPQFKIIYSFALIRCQKLPKSPNGLYNLWMIQKFLEKIFLQFAWRQLAYIWRGTIAKIAVQHVLASCIMTVRHMHPTSRFCVQQENNLQ